VIPTIDDILAMLLAGEMDRAKAKHWLAEHTRLAVQEVTATARDEIARDAMVAMISYRVHMQPSNYGKFAGECYQLADAMLAAREARDA